MQGLRYLESAVTLRFDAEKCTGCRTCTLVCPHGVWEMDGKRAVLADKGACMECGACALNCSAGAISVEPGVGCAAAIIGGWITGSEPTCGCGGECPDPDPASSGPRGGSSCC